ncbi:hypothetical protein C9374_001336 [Naegleria lovaniensis]|uniref:D-glutamate cyclase-like C-terminal domain-containing protein n=1 Tax=Naegleria lovaniensis TaxID=51637 RepID=A0AA88GRW8_NAELO|nr:uncharacterized protein C9374_001336 [Naegleria lovaniensis]KAG2387742.1 hypothetical protein C9374_001336 [Naegleria lovaniensis]
MSSQHTLFSSLSKIISQDLGTRGIDKLLQNASKDISEDYNVQSIVRIVHDYILNSIMTLVDSTSSSSENSNKKFVAIITGFSVPPNGYAETDGPLGAIWIGLGVLRFTPLNVLYFVDENQYEGMLKFLKMVFGNDEQRVKIVKVTRQDCNDIHQASAECKDYLDDIHSFISIERVGRSKDGKCYSMRGIEISGYNLALDIIIEYVQKKHPNTPLVSIGDGGNEIGMGSVLEHVEKCIPNGEKIACVMKSDFLLVCGVSNWGGYILYLLFEYCRNAIVENKPMQGIDVQIDLNYLTFMVNECQMVDGVRNQATISVDGLDYDPIHVQVVNELNHLFDIDMKKKNL